MTNWAQDEDYNLLTSSKYFAANVTLEYDVPDPYCGPRNKQHGHVFNRYFNKTELFKKIWTF